MVDKVHERDVITFVGGPCDGDKIITWAPLAQTRYIYRSTVKGDETLYRYQGIGFVKYYRFYDVWRYSELDSFTPLYVECLVK